MPAKEEYQRNPEKYRAKAREYALAHPEWKRESDRKWMRKKRQSPEYAEANRAATKRRYHSMTGEERVARREYMRKWFAARPGYGTKRNHARPNQYILRQARNRAKRDGLPFTLDISDVLIPSVCPVLGIPLVFTVGLRAMNNPNAPSLDRLIPALGYVKGNVRVISNRANILKNDATLAEIEAVAAYMRRELG